MRGHNISLNDYFEKTTAKRANKDPDFNLSLEDNNMQME